MKKIVCILLMMLALAACKEKSHEELAKEAIQDRDRNACLMEADAAISEKPIGAYYLLKASCYALPDQDHGVYPVRDRDEALSLIIKALDDDPSLRQQAEEVWTSVSGFITAVEDSAGSSLQQAIDTRESFTLTAENFWLDAYPGTHPSDKYETENITLENGNEIYYYAYLDELGRIYWQTHGYWTSGHNYVCETYTYSVFDHDYFPCVRKDYTFTNDEKYLGVSPKGKMEDGYLQTDYVNVFEYDEEGKIVKEYAYIYENGQISKTDTIIDGAPF